ncbi:MAG: hypothetical protein ACYC7L_04545 [Nitrospirota bacterium]
MQDRGLSEFKSFSGHLQAGYNIIPITFSARIDRSGEVEFDFEYIPLTNETGFLMKYWDDEYSAHNRISLSGRSIDGIDFKIDDLLVTLGHEYHKETGPLINLKGSCSRAEFHRKLVESDPKPVLRMHLKGFQNFGQLSSRSCLGTVTMGGHHSIDDFDTITGHISIYSDNEPADLDEWRKAADNLLEHIRRVMSFASASILQAPIIEFFADDNLSVVALSQTKHAPTAMRVFHYLDQQPVFDVAVMSFFNPPFKVNNLFFAIEWFAMDATYNEVFLLNAMTVLENLIASNLNEKDAHILLQKEFDKIRRNLRYVIIKCVDKWSADESAKSKEIIAELNERLADLNRRSILNKLKILAERWSVPLDGISDDKIKAAKRARDLIVHRGNYYEDGGKKRDDLWEHITVVREVVVRFLLTAIGYKGRYYSYLGGYHEEQFPPQVGLG